MALADYNPARQTVSFAGGSFAVRGFSLDDVTTILRDDVTSINEMLSMYAEGVPQNIMVDATLSFIMQMISRAPDLTARIIVTAADEPAALDKARILPIPVQVEAVQAIIKLTFNEFGGPKKFAANFQSLAATLTPRSESLPPNGSPT